MTAQDIQIIQQLWSRIAPQQEVAAELFYKRLFYLDPSIKAHIGQQWQQAGQHYMTLLDGVIRHLSQPTLLPLHLQALKDHHSAYRISSRRYYCVTQALIWTLETTLLEEFDQAIRDALRDIYHQLANAHQVDQRECVA